MYTTNWIKLLTIFEYYNLNFLFTCLSIMYLPCIFLGVKIMKNRKIRIVNNYFFYWNLLMSSLSSIGFLIAFPPVMKNINEIGFQNTICLLDNDKQFHKSGHRKNISYYTELVFFYILFNKMF